MKYPNEMTDKELLKEHDEIYNYFLNSAKFSGEDRDKLGILLGLDRELTLREGE